MCLIVLLSARVGDMYKIVEDFTEEAVLFEVDCESSLLKCNANFIQVIDLFIDIF